MKKFFVVFTAFAFVMAMGLPALANDDMVPVVPGEITITKAVYVGVKQVVKPSSSAEAHASKTDINHGNRVTETPSGSDDAVPPDYIVNPITGEYFQVPGTGSIGSAATVVTKEALIDGTSLDGASGIINVNQSPGSINNQGNAVAMSYSATAAPVVEITDGSEGETRYVGGAFLHAEASAEKTNGGLGVVDMGYDEQGLSIIVPLGNSVEANSSTRTNKIDGALGAVTGIVGVNQSAGSINNQNNAASLSVGDGIAALSNADLSLTNLGNTSSETATATSDTLTNGAFASASGIIGINQSSGCMNNQANVVAACVLVHP